MANLLRKATKVAGFPKPSKADAAATPSTTLDIDSDGKRQSEADWGGSGSEESLLGGSVGGGFGAFEVEELNVKAETDRFLATVEAFWPPTAILSRRMISGKIIAERKRQASLPNRRVESFWHSRDE